MFVREYNWHKGDSRYTQQNLLESASKHNETFLAGDRKYTVFGDEEGTLIGEVFDYILRDGGSSKSFIWRFSEYLR
jgi:hypothetical protein